MLFVEKRKKKLNFIMIRLYKDSGVIAGIATGCIIENIREFGEKGEGGKINDRKRSNRIFK